MRLRRAATAVRFKGLKQVLGERKGIRFEVLLPHIHLKDWGRSGPAVANLVNGADVVGFLNKEGGGV